MRGTGGSWRHQLVVLSLLVGIVYFPGGVSGQGNTTTPSRSNTCETGSWACGRFDDDRPECLPIEWRCDGKVDCTTSRNDEELCPTGTGSPCQANQTACGAEECIPTTFVCDRVNDCSDGADEHKNCTYTPCPADHFTCKDDRHCIEDKKTIMCNGIKDCGDGSDEAVELCTAPKCPAGQFMCKNGKCIDPSFVCSGSDDCGDNSDEDDSCGVDECKDKNMHGCSDICHNVNIKYYCSCKPGYELKSDNRTCQDIDECKKFPLVCSQFCHNNEGNFTCSCADGYKLENNVCIHTGDIEAVIIFANRYQIRRMSLNGSLIGRANEENEYVHVLDFYAINNTIYFADAGKGQIKRMMFNGSDEQIVIKHNLPLVEGLAVDWINDKLYWTDSRLAALFVANLNGTGVKTLHSNRTKLPRAIIVDPQGGYLYWTDWQLGAYIGRMGMDGSMMTKLITDGLFWPNALTIDYTTERLWWADAHLDKIETSKLDGSGRYVVVANLPHIYGINIFEEWMYWTDWNIKTIERANRFTGENRQQLAKMVHQPYDIHILHPLRQNQSIVNPCKLNNGGCSHLCLLAPGTVQGKPSFACVCPDHFILQADLKSCMPNCDNFSQFLCGRDDHRCIPKRWVCDGVDDCLGGEDEKQNCPADILCEPGSSPCKTGGKCVRDPRDICDGVDDCEDGSDEEEARCTARRCLPTEFRCSSGRCIPEQWKCDNDPDCPDKDDEIACDAPRNCTVDEFHCTNGKCIPELWKCDFDDDCGDQSDEPRDQCNKPCLEGWQKCATNHRCIPKLMFCDGDDDCRDNSDEDPEKCPTCGNGEWECDNKKCIPERWRCDFQDDCKDNSDEDTVRCADLYVACEENEFRCKNQKCIRDRYRCDHDDDCNDGSDEVGCASYSCPDDTFFQCTSGHCVLASFRCDGVRHCEDLSDELDCPTRYPGGRYCPENEFQCNTTVCIPTSWVCDAEDDCGDRSDETPSLCLSRPCDSDDRFRCRNNYCIRRTALCDKVNDCGDGSDENDFAVCIPPTSGCNTGDFKCTSGKCVPMPLVCNGQNDCGDMTDEHGCHSSGTGSCTNDNGGCEKNCTQVGSSYFCSCDNPGLRIDPTNKKLCIDIDECAAYKTNYCDQICINRDGSYKCECEKDFTKVLHPGGHVCKAAQAQTETILIAMENTIRQYRLSRRLYTDVITSRSGVRALDVDGANNLVYWTDPLRKTVFRSWVPMEASEVSLPQDLKIYNLDIVPEGIAYDWIGKNIYITDAKAGRIVVGKADGRYLKTIVDPSNRRPTRIAVSSTLGRMFWVDTVNKKIESAWMDGTNIRTLVSVNISDPTSIVVDHYMNSRLFWADTKRNVIESCKVDGTDRVIVAHQGLSNPFAVDVFQTQLFWVSQRNRSLYEFDKFGRGINISHSIQRNLLRPTDVKVQHRQRQPPVSADQDRCQSKGCYPLCVLIPNGARCMCPDGDSFVQPNTCNSARVAELKQPKPCICLNGGTCSLQADLLSVFCLCTPGFIGEKCENLISTASKPTASTAVPTWLPPGRTTPLPAGQTTDNDVSKGPGPGKGGSGALTAVIVPVVIVIVILAIIIIVVFVLYRRGVIGTKSGGGGTFRPGAPGLAANGNADNHYETPVVTFDPKDGGQANASFENPYYDTVHPNNNEAMGAQEYATTLPMKS